MKYVATRPFDDVDLGLVERGQELELTKKQAARLSVNGFVAPAKQKKAEVRAYGSNDSSD